MGSQVEGDRQAGLAGGQVLAVEGVGFLGGRKAGVLADRPGAAGIHRGFRAAHEGRKAGQVVQMLQFFRSSAEYSGFTAMPSGVSQTSSSGERPLDSLVASSRHCSGVCFSLLAICQYTPEIFCGSGPLIVCSACLVLRGAKIASTRSAASTCSCSINCPRTTVMPLFACARPARRQQFPGVRGFSLRDAKALICEPICRGWISDLPSNPRSRPCWQALRNPSVSSSARCTPSIISRP